MTVTAVTVPGLVDILNSANPVVQWATPIITVVLALFVGGLILLARLLGARR